MKEINPKNILFFLLTVLLGIVLISVIIPENGIKISDNLAVNAPDPFSLFEEKKVEYADISDIIETQKEIEKSIEKEPKKDEPKKIDTIKADTDKLKAKIQNIDFSKSGKNKLYNFFKKISKVDSTGELIRIWHFGDSQIEGARITGRIREKLQQEFGGYGPGFIEIVPVVDKPSWEIKASDNWKTYNIFGLIDSNVTHRNYGPLMKFFTFTKYDSLETDSNQIQKATVEFNKTYYAQDLSEKFDLFKIYYGNAGYTSDIAIINKSGDTLAKSSLPKADTISEISFGNISDEEFFTIHISSRKSPDFYCASFESESGIIMDNIALRGSPGLFFTKTNESHLKKMFRLFDVDLILWEFGVNMVSDETENFGFYKTRIKRQMKRIKEIAPNLPVIIIGVSDKSKKEGIYYKSLESVEKVRNIQREAAIESGFAFWDMYEAMGGRNSMPSWVFAEPPLAQEDFTHFNHKGAEIISNMFYNALIYEYKKFREEQN